MGKREIYLLIATIGIEIIAVGVGVMVSPSYGWAIAIIGGVIFLVFLWFAIKTKESKAKQLSLADIDAQRAGISERIERRKQYLPQLKQLIGEYINRVEELAKTDDRVKELERYKTVYTTTKLFKRLSRGDETGALIGELYKQLAWKDNLVFRAIEDEDNVLVNISAQVDNLAANEHDTQVKNYIKGFRLAAHMAYSYMILNKISRIHEGSPPMLLKFHHHQERKILDAFRKHQNDVNSRIDELLKGVEDE
ncbi:hypothetical protein ACFLV1_01965 [Chloroflexota bacterium]